MSMIKQSGIPGITWDKFKSRWFVKVTVDYKQISLGRYADLEDAKQALEAYRADPDAERVRRPTGRPRGETERTAGARLRARQHAVWRRMQVYAAGFVAWGSFAEFADWLGGEPQKWGLEQIDKTKPLGPDNAVWIDKPENRWDRSTPEGRREYAKEHRKSKVTTYRGYALKRDYGLTLAEYMEMHEAQGGVCAICKEPETTVKNGQPAMLAVDHCHGSGKVRGLLCMSCNLGLGYFKDDAGRLASAIGYLRRCD
jgi:hypothetical protein